MADIKLQGVVVPPAGVTDGGFGAASSAFGNAARNALQIGDKLEALEIEEGKEQAISDAAGVGNETLQTTKREKRAFDFLRVTDEAYTNASEILALQRAESAGESKLTDLETEYAFDPEGYQRASAAWLGSYLKGDLPSDLVRQVEGSFAGMQKDGLARIARTKRAADLKEAENGINARVEMTERKMDAFLRENGALGANDPAFIKMTNELQAQLALKAGNPAFKYSEEEMERDLTKVSDSMSKSLAFKTAVDLYDAAGGNEDAVTVAYKGIEEIIDGLGLPSDEAQSTRTALRKEVDAKHDLNKQEIGMMDAEEKRRKDFVAGNLKVEIERGAAGYGDIERHKEDLSGAKYAELTLAVDRVNEKKVKEASAQAFGEALFDGTAVANPLDPKHQEALNTYFKKNIAPDLAHSSDPVGVAVDFVSKTNTIPKAMENTLVGQLMNGEPLQQIEAINILSAVQSEAPVAYDQLPSKAKRLAGYANMLQEAGMAPENAVIRARESLYVDDGIRKARETALTKKVMDDALKRASKDLELQGFDDNLGARADYTIMYEAEFLATGDEEAAHYMAQQRLNTVWGESAVTEGVMRNPPEKLYGVGGLSDKANGKWIKQEFESMLAKEDAEAFQNKDYVPLKKRSRLVADRETSRGDGSYGVFYSSPDLFGGEITIPLVRDGVPVRFKPDWETSSEKKRQEKVKNSQFERNKAIHRNKVYGEPLGSEFFANTPGLNPTNPITGQRF